MTEKELCLRAKRAHERIHGQSIWIECSYMPALSKVCVNDRELGIITYWNIDEHKRRAITFEKQLGERT